MEVYQKDLIRPGTTTEYVDFRISDRVESDFRSIDILPPQNFTKYQDDQNNTIDE